MRQIIYFQSERGDSPVQEFIDSLSVKEQAKCLAYIELLRASPLRLPASVAKKVEGQVLAESIVFVHALRKKTQQLKRADIDLALRRAEDYQAAHEEDMASE